MFNNSLISNNIEIIFFSNKNNKSKLKFPKKNRKNKIKMYLILIFQTVKKKKLRRLS